MLFSSLKPPSARISWVLVQLGVLLIPVDIVVPVGGVRMTLCEVVLTSAFFSWIMAAWKNRATLPGIEFVLPILFVFLASTLSITAAHNKFLAVRETVQFAWMFGIFMMLLSVVRGPIQSIRIATLLVASGALSSLLGLYQYFFFREPVDLLIAATRLRASGFYDQPNTLGSYLIGSAPLLWGLLLIEPPQGGAMKRTRRWLLLGTAFLYGLALTATFSRGSWIGLTGGIVFLLILVKGRVNRKQLAAFVTVFLVGAAVVHVDFSLQPEWKGRSFSNKQRLMLLSAGYEMFKDHPLVGVGSGNYPARLTEYASQELRESMQVDYDRERKEFYFNPQKKPDVELVHNIVLQIGTETGIAGLASFGFFFIVFWRKAWSNVKAFSEHGGILRAAPLVGVIAILGGGMFGWPFTHGVQEILIVAMSMTLCPPSSTV